MDGNILDLIFVSNWYKYQGL